MYIFTSKTSRQTALHHCDSEVANARKFVLQIIPKLIFEELGEYRDALEFLPTKELGLLSVRSDVSRFLKNSRWINT